jgi:hypothetical protein
VNGNMLKLNKNTAFRRIKKEWWNWQK